MSWRRHLVGVFCPLVAVSVLLAACGPTDKLLVHTVVAEDTVEATRPATLPETAVVARQTVAQEVTSIPPAVDPDRRMGGSAGLHRAKRRPGSREAAPGQ